MYNSSSTTELNVDPSSLHLIKTIEFQQLIN